MEQILEPNENFKFDNLVLSSPIFINSGNYFIKYLYQNSPLYIQVPKCITKQGVIKAGKKMYCDFLFTNENESFIRWIEDLENYSQKYIYENRSKWFENDLEMHDIENSFTSPLKIYKSGKFYIIRTIIPTRLGNCTLNIYDENEMDLDINTIKDGTSVMSIWEVQGIKCSSKNFQIDIEVKQMMVIKPSKLFDKCIISKKNLNNDINNDIDNDIVNNEDVKYQNEIVKEENTKIDIVQNDEDYLGKMDNTVNMDISSNMVINETSINTENEINSIQFKSEDDVKNDDSDSDTGSQIEVLEMEEDEIDNEEINPTTNLEKTLEIVDLNTENIDDEANIQLKNRNDVYYEIYMEAKKKAEEARNLAIFSYLEAKRIKDLYLIQDFLEFKDPKI